MDLVFESIKKVIDESTLNLYVYNNLQKSTSKTFKAVVQNDVSSVDTTFKIYDYDYNMRYGTYELIKLDSIDNIVGYTIKSTLLNETRNILSYNKLTGYIEIDAQFSQDIVADDTLSIEISDVLCVYPLSTNSVRYGKHDFRVNERYIFRLLTQNDEYREKQQTYQKELIRLFAKSEIIKVDESLQDTNKVIYIIDNLNWNQIKINESEHIVEGTLRVSDTKFVC